MEEEASNATDLLMYLYSSTTGMAKVHSILDFERMFRRTHVEKRSGKTMFLFQNVCEGEIWWEHKIKAQYDKKLKGKWKQMRYSGMIKYKLMCEKENK